MQEVKTEIEINAPALEVWNILMDFKHWKDWSPIINDANGEASINSQLAITMNGKNEKAGPKYKPTITYMEEAKFFQWRAKMIATFLFTNYKVFELQETINGTRLIHKEMFEGLLASLFCRNLDNGVKPMLDSMNKALKDKVEQSSTSDEDSELPSQGIDAKSLSTEQKKDKETEPV